MSSPAATTIDIPAQVGEAVVAAHEHQAIDLLVLHLEPVTSLAEYFLICSGRTDRQTRAIADAVEDRLRADRIRPLHVEGLREGQWILLDYGDFIVHVMTEDRRAFYGLEGLWSDAPDVTKQFPSSDESAETAPASG